jgi:hypothetical protein
MMGQLVTFENRPREKLVYQMRLLTPLRQNHGALKDLYITQHRHSILFHTAACHLFSCLSTGARGHTSLSLL